MRRDGGKGDKKRPLTVPKEQFESNWDAIFNNPNKNDPILKIANAIHDGINKGLEKANERLDK